MYQEQVKWILTRVDREWIGQYSVVHLETIVSHSQWAWAGTVRRFHLCADAALTKQGKKLNEQGVMEIPLMN